MNVLAAPLGNNRLRPRLRRIWAIGIVAVAAGLATAFQPFDNGPVIRSDGYGYHAWTYAILRGDLNFEGLPNETYAFHETRPGYWWDVYPPGIALIRFPVMAPLVGRGDQFGRPTPAEHVAAATLSALALVATAVLLFYVCIAAGASSGSANVAILAAMFGTGVFHYATYDASYSHCWTALGMAALVALAVRSRSRGGRIPAASLVTLAAWLLLVRNTNVFALAIVGTAWAILAPRQFGVPGRTACRHAAWLAVGAAIGIAVQLALNGHAYGRFTVSSYEGRLFEWDRPMQWSVLMSMREHGLFPYYPVAALFLVVPFGVRRLWPAATVFVLLVGVYATLYGFWNMWNLGASFGHRGFVDVLVVGCPLFAVALTRLPRWPRRAVIAATFLCLYVTVNLMAGYWRQSLPYHQVTREVYWSHLVGERTIANSILR